MAALGTATDPYQPCEGRYRLTRRTLETLIERSVALTIVTKNPMIVRDVDLLAQLARRADLVVHFSVTTMDRDLWRRIEPRTASPGARLRALAILRERGVRAGVLCAPLVPDLTDGEGSILAVARAAKAHGAISFGSRPLKLEPGTREVWFGFVAAQFPELLPRNLERYRRGPYADAGYVKRLEARFDAVRDSVGFHDVRYRRGCEAPNAPVQLSLVM